ncbi:hypothetical protein AVEN_85617-1 [Araneus ventricosus]|uniref:Uncharacterized protein n=1 Tax=Araneus ventricosus TaxID=182803 RepID=A0A4Y2SRZ8_ARAVE|nr:hypothetical protein AVEN_122357-1 [Araneus ventricosus]GBO29654.1 hypothetical protein AVEN_85617-1 [Araneus ventricosus]
MTCLIFRLEYVEKNSLGTNGMEWSTNELPSLEQLSFVPRSVVWLPDVALGAVVRNPTSRAAPTTHIESKAVRKNYTEVFIRYYLAFKARAFFHPNCLATPTQLEQEQIIVFLRQEFRRTSDNEPQATGSGNRAVGSELET